MRVDAAAHIADAIAESARRLSGATDDYAPLVTSIGEARFVLLGEATHGTQEFYTERARITRALIERRGLRAIAVEADWPDAYRVNRYVRCASDDRDATESLDGFRRFPTWMWRNSAIVEFVEWLRDYNAAHAPRDRVGFYGLDLYSLYTSIDAVLRYLDDSDPDAARRARQRYRCFDHFDRDSTRYAYAAGFGANESCEDSVVAQLADMLKRTAAPSGSAVGENSDEAFYALQNARLVKTAEEYYRTMFRGRVSSWNLRDRHMADTLDALDAHLSRERPARIAVWAHNSHVGDARATQMGAFGEWTLGQLVRERHRAADGFAVGFTTDHGTVIAASDWDGPAQRKRVRPARDDSYEHVFHRCGIGNFLLPLRGTSAAIDALRDGRLERAIGVIYLPETERASHYFDASLPRQFDAVVHWDETRALEPLEPLEWLPGSEEPEAYPTGL